MTTLKYLGDQRYSGDDGEKQILVNHGKTVDVSDHKAKYLLTTFPIDWEIYVPEPLVKKEVVQSFVVEKVEIAWPTEKETETFKEETDTAVINEQVIEEVVEDVVEETSIIKEEVKDVEPGEETVA